MGMVNNMIDMATGQGMMSKDLMAMEFLLSCKEGVRNCAIALTESATPEVREALKEQLSDAVQLHEEAYRYVEEKGLYHPRDFSKQVEVDMRVVNKATE